MLSDFYEGVCVCGFSVVGMSRNHAQALLFQHKKSHRHKERMETIEFVKPKLLAGEEIKDSYKKIAEDEGGELPPSDSPPCGEGYYNNYAYNIFEMCPED